jgi:hypothetical protein
MRHLKKLVCYKITDEMLRVYQMIKSHPHHYVNTTFEFIAKPDMKSDTIFEEFNEGTVKKKTHWPWY